MEPSRNTMPENQKLPELLTGDIILTRSSTTLSKLIIWFEKMQTKKADRSHAAMFFTNGLCIESLWRIRINDVEEKYGNQDIEIWRIPLSKSERLDLMTFSAQLAGDSYGITKIPLFAMDGLASLLMGKKVFWFTKHLGMLNIPVCSQFIVYSIIKATQYRFLNEKCEEVGWREVSPDYLQDLLNIRHNGAELIFKQIVSPK